jgi:hypothetical protein
MTMISSLAKESILFLLEYGQSVHPQEGDCL